MTHAQLTLPSLDFVGLVLRAQHDVGAASRERIEHGPHLGQRTRMAEEAADIRDNDNAGRGGRWLRHEEWSG